MKLLFKILILTLLSINANSETLILGVERDWTAYRSDSGDKRTCFISSEPKSSKGDYKKENRGDVRVYVTHGPSQDVIHAMRLLKKIKYRYKLSLNAKYQLWLNNSSKTADKKFCKLVDNSYRNWRYYYLKKMGFERNSSNQEIIKTLQLKINWNNSYINSKNKKSFYNFLSEKF